MRFALKSAIHSNSVTLEAVLTALAIQNLTQQISLGSVAKNSICQTYLVNNGIES